VSEEREGGCGKYGLERERRDGRRWKKVGCGAGYMKESECGSGGSISSYYRIK
jgi:hypothetical protein